MVTFKRPITYVGRAVGCATLGLDPVVLLPSILVLGVHGSGPLVVFAFLSSGILTIARRTYLGDERAPPNFVLDDRVICTY